MSSSEEFSNEIARLMRDPDSIRPKRDHAPHTGRRGHYDPNQRRAAAGNSNGGQWIDAGDGIGDVGDERPQIERAVLADEALADMTAGHLPIELVAANARQRRFPNPIELIDAARLGLYNELTARNSSAQQAVIEFRAAQYGRRAVDVVLVSTLTRSDVGKLCERFEKVQALTDASVAEVTNLGANMSPQQFGTAVHVSLKEKIMGLNDAYLKAEVSFLKGFADDYGVKGTVRIDAFERVKRRPDTVCIDDIKTGRSGLSFPRMLEMVVNSQKAFGGQIRHFIVTEVRPTQ